MKKYKKIDTESGVLSYSDAKANENVVDTTTFNNNLSTADTDVQKALETIDNLSMGSLPTGTVNQTLRHNGTNWVVNDILQVKEGTVPSGAVNKLWLSCSMNNNGDCIAIAYNGRIYTRTAGVWSEQQPLGAVNKSWYCCSINDMGNCIVGNSTRLYTRIDGVWSEQQPAGDIDKTWQSCSINENNQCIAGNTQNIYIRENDVWTSQSITGNWNCCSINNNGNCIAGTNGYKLYVRTDGIWSEQQPAGLINKNWYSCSINDSNDCIVVVSNGRLYTRTNGVWTEQQPAGNISKLWSSCSINSNGDCIAGVSGGRLYIRTAGVWSEQQPAGAVDKTWRCCSINNNGDCIAGVYSGRLYARTSTVWSEQYPYLTTDTRSKVEALELLKVGSLAGTGDRPLIAKSDGTIAVGTGIVKSIIKDKVISADTSVFSYTDSQLGLDGKDLREKIIHIEPYYKASGSQYYEKIRFDTTLVRNQSAINFDSISPIPSGATVRLYISYID